MAVRRLSALTGALAAVLVAHVAMGAEPMHDPHHEDGAPVLVDTDMALDDVRAIYALLAEPGLEVRGVATVEGSASVGRGTDNLVGLLEDWGADDLPVLRGEPLGGANAPHWRGIVDGLRGATYPPPRGRVPVTAAASGYADLLAGAPGATLLALGPLTNLARAQRDRPGALDPVARIWMPVDFVDPHRLDAWNLQFDPAAARSVFASGRPIVLLDVTPETPADPAAVLQGLMGETPAVRWIERTMEGERVAAPHWLIYDELAVAALARPDLITLRPQRYALDADAAEFVLVEDESGPIEVAEISDLPGAVAWLRERWQSGRAGAGGHAPAVADETEALLRSFHGHLGPYVVLGYRMGQLALAELGSDGHFDIRAHVHSPLQPPASCLIDGVQLGSGCTLGKRNIELSEIEGPAFTVFTAGDGREVTVRLHPDLPDRIRAMVDEMGVEAAAQVLLGEDEEILFLR
jgi:inosine-uridine nucleoside N-ribohydrolase